MEQREGSGWETSGATADALAALTRYAVEVREKPVMGRPILTLNDHPVQIPGDNSTESTISLIIPGSELHPGTNWLKLKPSSSGQSLYYSLTLKATR